MLENLIMNKTELVMGDRVGVSVDVNEGEGEGVDDGMGVAVDRSG